MEKAVDVAESNMARFGLTQQEVSSRRKWVSKTRQQVCVPSHSSYAMHASDISTFPRQVLHSWELLETSRHILKNSDTYH